LTENSVTGVQDYERTSCAEFPIRCRWFWNNSAEYRGWVGHLLYVHQSSICGGFFRALQRGQPLFTV